MDLCKYGRCRRCYLRFEGNETQFHKFKKTTREGYTRDDICEQCYQRWYDNKRTTLQQKINEQEKEIENLKRNKNQK